VLSAPDDKANVLAINKQEDITMEFDVFRPESSLKLEDKLIPVGILVLTYSDMHEFLSPRSSKPWIMMILLSRNRLVVYKSQSNSATRES
jgi:hypothetical protein